MSHPFQKFPKYDEFYEWLNEHEKIEIKTVENKWGETVLLTNSETKKSVFLECDIQVIGPETIQRIESRLGIKTPWTFLWEDDL
ncbi:MAG: hypothetical protein OXC82_03570 [Rhodobacteraceae bacterium]|nr:hypothetical protein [Paracoccaceae bacterium]MCY4249502.1 hypothetical protein [Paracoccaceae bacterium]MCY4308328.1 hypothetical protein [Paracoccaceae bacterium]